jgi:EAL domain-containing protein (putative c-di-GMP-specific phosphodiesterase class I)
MMEDVELAISRLNDLRGLGVLLAIDDFGTGYSSLNSIRRFPIDILKIDRSFIQDVAHGSAQTQALTATIIDLAGTLGLRPVAEGIEDAAQLARLRELDCALGQGYHLYPPLPADEVMALVRKQNAGNTGPEGQVPLRVFAQRAKPAAGPRV